MIEERWCECWDFLKIRPEIYNGPIPSPGNFYFHVFLNRRPFGERVVVDDIGGIVVLLSANMYRDTCHRK